MFEKAVVVTRKTRLQELIERFNTHGQAKFYIESSGGDFKEYQREDDHYKRSLETVLRSLIYGLKVQPIDRSLIPTLSFQKSDLVLAVGQDGLVANTAKYIGSQPLIGINPDPEKFDGILLPFKPEDLGSVLPLTLEGKAKIRSITLAEARFNDGQRLLAFNDFFIGALSHISARYQIEFGGKSESQSSSGIIVSTGAGSTGWFSSACNMVNGLAPFIGGTGGEPLRLEWEDRRLLFVVREPFLSKHSSVGIVAGMVDGKAQLEIESRMPTSGAVFSDGVEADFIQFNAGSRVVIRAADHQAKLVVN